MKKLLVIALLCFMGANVKAQSLNLVYSHPGYDNDLEYASHPIVTLDAATGYLHYAFTVNYATAHTRGEIRAGGTLISLALSFDPYSPIEYLEEFTNETMDYNTLPFGLVTHHGSFYIGNRYNSISLISINAGTGYNYVGDPNHVYGYTAYDEYELIP